MGRTDVTDPNRVRCAWPATGIQATFVGTYGEVQLIAPAGAVTFASVYVDDTKQVIQVTDAGVVVQIPADTSRAQHTIRVVKRTDPYGLVLHITGLRTSDGGYFLAPPTRKIRRLEFIGASNVTGYGVEGFTDKDCSTFGGLAVSNGELSYPMLAGVSLDAEVMNLAYSGKGIYRNGFPGDTVKTLPFIHGRVIPDDPNGPVWDFSSWQPDAVVVDAGGVDMTVAGADSPGFAETYARFVQTLRGKYPNATIVAAVTSGAVGTDRDVLSSAVTASVARARELGVQNLVYFEFAPYNGAQDGYGCIGHYSKVGAQHVADDIAQELRTLLNW